MATNYSPKIVSDSLVLCYDLYNKKKSWKGPPTTNLLNNNLSSFNDIYLRSTKTIISDNEVRFVNNGTGGTTVRLYVDNGILVNGNTYGVSVYVKDVVGTVSFDWCDTGVSGGVNSLTSNGRLQGLGTRSDYSSTYRFLDINISTGGSATLYNAQIDSIDMVTDYILPGTSRLNTEAIIDISGKYTITANSLTYNSDGTFSFDGTGDASGDPTGDYISVPESITNTSTSNYPNGCTYVFWLNVDTDADNRLALLWGAGTFRHIEIYSSGKLFRTEAATQNGYSFGSGSFPDNVRGVWSQFAIVFANNEINRPVYWYQNGKLFYTHASMESGTDVNQYFSFSGIGRATGSPAYSYAKSFKGKIPFFNIYSRSLTTQEIKQNYNALKGRFI